MTVPRLALRIGLPFAAGAAAWQHWIWPTLTLLAVWVYVCWVSDEVLVEEEDRDD